MNGRTAMRILYTPTDRPAARALEQGVTECAALREVTGEPYLYLLVEHRDTDVAHGHAALLDRLAHQHDVPVLHLTAAGWRDLLARMLAATDLDQADRQRVARLLSPTAVAYGAGPNKAYLVASAFGASVVHRRDSDQEIEVVDGVPRYPGVLEAAAIGRRLDEVPDLRDADTALAQRPEARVGLVGFAPLGDPAHDRRDLLAADLELAIDVEMATSPGCDRRQVAEIIQWYYHDEPATRYDEDFFELQTFGAKAEMGASCVTDIFTTMPESIVTDALSADYFQRALLLAGGAPVLFQSRKMRHVYDTERSEQTDPARAAAYALRDLKGILAKRVTETHGGLVRANPERYLSAGLRLDGARYADTLEKCVPVAMPGAAEVIDRFQRAYSSAAKIADGALATRAAAIADAVADAAGTLVPDVERELREFCWLVRRWPSLVRAAAQVGAEVRQLVHCGPMESA
jgi:uncharacterized protein DUF6271